MYVVSRINLEADGIFQRAFRGGRFFSTGLEPQISLDKMSRPAPNILPKLIIAPPKNT